MPAFDDNSFRALDFNKADFVKIKQDLSEIEWDQLRDLCSFEEFPILFTDSFASMPCINSPEKTPIGEAKAIKCFAKEEKRIEARLSAVLCRGQLIHARSLQNKLALIHYDIKDAICKEQEKREQNAVERIKSNQKFFYSYAKSFHKLSLI